MNLLLAEDDAVARMTLSAVLRGLGYEVTEAEHGGEAWANLQLGHFPIVISDWSMPEIDGPELCRRLRGRATDKYSYFLFSHGDGRKEALPRRDGGGSGRLHHEADRHGRVARSAQSR